MNCKRSLSAFLSLLMVVTMVASVLVLPVAAAEENGNVSFRSPAITANVGETIDLTKYGVEFTEGVTTSDGLTWWDASASTTVPYTAPAILTDVGETVDLTDWSVEFTNGTATDAANISWQKKLDENTVTFGMPAILTDAGETVTFADYPVELTEGNIVAGSKLTWTQSVASSDPLITFVSPAIPANVGDVVDLTKYAVEFENDVATRPAAITWADAEGTAVTAFTPTAAGVTALTATAGSVSKTVYVVAKNEADTEYVLYENDFNEETDLADLVNIKSGTAAGTESIADGKFTFVRTSSTSASNRMYMLPEWLCAFGDYTLEMNATVNAQANTGRYIGFLFRGTTGTDARPYGIVGFDRKRQLIMGDRSTAEGTAWNPNWYKSEYVTSAYTLPALGTAATYKMSIIGDTLTAWYEDTQIKQMTVPATMPEMGRPGIMTAGLDFDIDYYKVTIAADSVKTATYVDTYSEYTPAKGVTAFDVTDGTTTKTVYVVAKDAADTEYVLYENDFNEETDLDELTRASNCTNASSTVEIVDGKLAIGTGDMWHETYMLLPEFIGDFGDYYVETGANITAQKNNTRYIGLLLRVDNDSYPFHVAMMKQNGAISITYRNEDNAWATDLGHTQNTASGSSGLTTSTYFTMAAEVSGDTYTQYINGAKKLALTGQDQQRTGRVGIVVNSATANADYIKVTVSEPAKTEAATTFTPVTAGVTEFIATAADGTEKSVYVVAKEAGDTEYVLYENDFDTAASLSDVIRVNGGTDTNYPYAVSDGALTVTRVNNNSGNTTLGFPMWLADFGDYTIETSIAITAQKNTSRYYGPVFRGNPDMDDPVPYYASLYYRDGKWAGQRRVSVTTTDWNSAWDTWAGPSVSGAFTAAALGTYATHTVDVKGDTATAYYNGTQVGTYTPTDVRDTGFVGLFFTAMDAKIDYFKVTVSEPEVSYEEITAFTPTKAGVTALKVTDADGNEKNVYIVAKEADDTEYVLYENEFENAYDANSLTVVGGSAEMAVESGALTLTTTGAYVRLPAFLGEFGDYKMDMVATTDSYGAATDWIALFGRGQNEDSALDSYVMRVRHTNNSWDSTGYYHYDASGTMNRYSWGRHTAVSTGAAHTYTLQAKDDLLTMKQDGTYVFYAEEEKALRTGHIGFAVSNVTLSVDSIRVTLEDTERPNAPLSAAFTPDAGLPYGTIAGSLSVELDAAGDAAVDVAYYWGDGDGKLDGYGAFDKILVSGKTAVTDTIPAGTVVPAGATELRVYTANEAGESETCVVIPLPLSVRAMTTGEETLSFQMASDSHTLSGSSVNQALNDQHFIDLLQDIAVFDPDSAGLFHGGDIVDNGKIAEYEHFKEIWDTYSNGLALEGIIGNHEYWDTATHADTVNNFATYTGIAITPETPYYTKNIGGYDFFFLNSSIIDPSGGNHNISTLGETQLAWLDAGLAAVDADTPVFVFHHQKFNQIDDADALKAILAKYPNAIFMTSHTHTDMNTASIFEYANDTMCNTANTSAVSYTVYTHYNPSGENVNHRSQAYYVEVYEDRVLFRGMDIMTNEWIPSAQFVFWYGDVDTYPTDANLFPAASGAYEEFTFDASALTAVGDDGFTEADTATVAELEEKFNFYYDREGVHYRERDLFDNLDDNDNYNPAGTATGWSKWVPSGAWLQRTTGKTSGEMFRKIDALVPLNSAGEEVVAENFETTFDVKFVNYNGGVILGFRQREAGHFTNGYYNLVKTMGFVSINKGGMSIASGSDILSKSGGDATTDMYNHFETDFETDLPETVTVKVRVVGTAVTVEIYDYSTKALLHSEQDTLSYTAAGKIAYGVSAVGHSIGNIELTKLNRFGAPLDIAVNGDYENGALQVVGMEETGAGYKYTFALNPDAGYELQAGSLYVTDANGNCYVPQRVGFREGGDASLYTVTIAGEGSVYAAFTAPTAETPNIGNLGTSVNKDLAGVRFISRFTRTVEDGTEYVVLDGEKYAVSDYGMLMGLEKTVGDNELNLALTESNKYVLKLSVKESGIYYDLCDDHIDMSVCITGVDKVTGGADMDISSRAYVVLENGDVLYGTVLTSSYNETMGVYTTETLAALETAGTIEYHGRNTVSGTARVFPAYGGSGFTVSGEMGGDMWVTLNHSEYACVLNVVVDDDTENVKSIWLEAGDATVKVVDDLADGNHTVTVTRGTSNYGTLTIKSVTYRGTLSTPTANPLQIEFLGDSITAAGGGDFDYGDGSYLAKSKAHNTFLGYAAQTARNIGADMTMVAKSGYTTLRLRNLWNDSSWDYTANHKDIVVINLGTNDFGYAGKPAPSEIEGFTDVCNGLISDVRAAYGEDTYIIWAYGMMFDKDKDFLDELVDTYRTENSDDKVFFCDLSAAKNNDGYSNHPNQAGHDAAAALLTAFIEENCADVLS